LLLTKEEARREALRRWHALPPDRRRTFEDAAAFAASPGGRIEFQTVADPQKIVTAWLIRDLAAEEQPLRLSA
jgi:hypothetical protein